MINLIAFLLLNTPPERCVVDRCEERICVLETPVGSTEVKKKPAYEESLVLKCIRAPNGAFFVEPFPQETR